MKKVLEKTIHLSGLCLVFSPFQTSVRVSKLWGVSASLCILTRSYMSSSNGCLWTPAADQEAGKFFLLVCIKSAERSVNLDQLVEWLPTEFYLWNWCGIILGESPSTKKTMGLYREGKMFPELVPSPARRLWPFLWHCPYSMMNIIAELEAVFLLHPETLDVKQNKCKFWYVAR